MTLLHRVHARDRALFEVLLLPHECTTRDDLFRDRHRSRGLCKELVLVDQRPVGVRVQEILGQDLVEARHIARRR